MKVALVHDYLREYGGAERVLEVIHELFPDAPLYTAYYNPEALGPYAKNFQNWVIRTSWMQKVPFANKLLSLFRIFAIKMFESFDLSEYDLVISSSSAVYFAKSVLTKPGTLHLSYIHTPPRFLYGYTTSFNYKKHLLTRIGGEVINHFLRIYDFEVSQRPDILVANSKNVQARIKKFYRRDSVVIYPPVDTMSFWGSGASRRRQNLSKKDSGHGSNTLTTGARMTRGYFLALNRLVRGKGTEIIVEAATRLNLILKVAGTGPEMAPLRASSAEAAAKADQGFAGYKNIEFLGWVSDEERVKLLQSATALIVASEDEDFGITPVEAQAVGTPVIAPASGGFLETVIDGKTGILYGKPGQVDVESLIEGIKRFNDENHFNKEVLRKNAEKFSKERFKKEILALIKKGIDKNVV